MRTQPGATLIKSIQTSTAAVVDKLFTKDAPDVSNAAASDSSDEMTEQEKEKILEKSLYFRDLQITRLPAHEQSVFCAVGRAFRMTFGQALGT